MEPERRHHIRHIPLKQNAFAALGHSFAKTGRIKNISLGGLSFEYILGQSIPADDDSRVDIFLTDKPLHIRGAQCLEIYDDRISIPQMVSDNSSSITLRRAGIKFITLSEKHREQLNILINFFCSNSI